jgi:light-regulated signal transduction histidine kinase (bacteriophytochrome)
VLRSVSPIHVEYLQNMGVGASMSVSIVVAGELWGMVACHHMSPRQLPYSVRMSCDVLAQVVAATVQTLLARDQSRRRAEAAALITSLVTDVDLADDLLAALHTHGATLLRVFEADALVLAQGARVRVIGELPLAVAQAMLGALPDGTAGVQALEDLADWPEPLRALLDGWVGALLLPVDQVTQSRVLLLRREQVHTVRWGGAPEKQVTIGPLGPRLTPRGSFDEWRETVRGRSVPWGALSMQTATELFNQVQRASLVRHAETESARQRLLAMLGHDLRDPLQAIHMVAGLLRQDEQVPRLAQRLEASSRRMQRLISQVLDFSRADAGLPLGSGREPVDLLALLDDLVEESRMGHPDVPVVMHVDTSGPVRVLGDPGRLAQLVGNLLGNARHHGAPLQQVQLALTADASNGAGWRIDVRNVADPIDADIVPTLFQAIHRRSRPVVRNGDGLGLGLYIAACIAAEHAAELQYRYEAPHVVFSLRLPALA